MLSSTLHDNLERSRVSVERGQPANFTPGYFALVAREAFHAGEK